MILILRLISFSFAFLLVASCSHHQSLSLTNTQGPLFLKIADQKILVTPVQQVSFDNKSDVMIIKFEPMGEVLEPLRIEHAQIELKVASKNLPLLSDDELKRFAAQEQAYGGNTEIGQLLGSNRSYGELYQLYSQRRLVKEIQQRNPSSVSEKALFEFFLVPKQTPIHTAELVFYQKNARVKKQVQQMRVETKASHAKF